MLVGQSLRGSGTTVYSPWFPRGGNQGLFSAEALLADGGGGVTVTVESKNTEDIDSAATAVGASGAISSGVGTFLGTNLKELVRYKYVLSGGSSAWVHFRVLPPAWISN